MSATLNTITADDWKRSIARARATRNTVADKIRAKLAAVAKPKSP